MRASLISRVACNRRRNSPARFVPAGVSVDDPGRWQQAFDRFEHDRKPRAERIVAAGRRIASDKAIVSPLKSKIRNFMMSVVLRLFGIPGQDWAFRYRIQWD